jgi:hypothetical protein
MQTATAAFKTFKTMPQRGEIVRQFGEYVKKTSIREIGFLRNGRNHYKKDTEKCR